MRKLITSLNKEDRRLIGRAIREAIVSGKKKFKINFNGGEPETVNDIKSLMIGEKSITFDNGRFIDIKNIKSISAESKEIIIFTREGKIVIFAQ